MIVPASRNEFFGFCDSHADAWTEHAVAIGTSVTAVSAWKTAYNAAMDQFVTANTMRLAAKTQTTIANEALRDARTKTSDIVRNIKNFAVNTDDPDVYTLAMIPPPADPSTVPPPGQPFEVACDLNPNGQLTLRWKCDNPMGAAGTFYTVRRRLGNSGPFVIVGGSGTKAFVDGAIPAGTPRVVYIVNGQRGNSTGPASSEFTVNFGVGGDGAAFIAGTSTGQSGGAMKMAA